MKTYKGWEIIKMISEGKFKDGTIIKSDDGNEYIVEETLGGTQCLCRKQEIRVVENSFLTNPNRTFSIKRKTYNFLEAMKMIFEGKKMTNSWLEENRCADSYYYKRSNGELGFTLHYNFGMYENELNADWYEFEEEQC